jgi:hypothetical protein
MMNDYKLDLIAKAYAEDIFAEMKADGWTQDDAREAIWDMVDGSEHVIYYGKAHNICQTCDITNGEAFAEEIGLPEVVTYDNLASQIAFGELLYRVTVAFYELIEDYNEEAETA